MAWKYANTASQSLLDPIPSHPWSVSDISLNKPHFHLDVMQNCVSANNSEINMLWKYNLTPPHW